MWQRLRYLADFWWFVRTGSSTAASCVAICMTNYLTPGDAKDLANYFAEVAKNAKIR